MSSGVTRAIYGAVTGSAALLPVTTVGFRPRKVSLFNETSRVGLYWQEGMADDSALKTAAAGTRTVVTADAIIPLSNGFSVGTDSVNAADEVLRFEAHE